VRDRESQRGGGSSERTAEAVQGHRCISGKKG
jgi:hypothetical protein